MAELAFQNDGRPSTMTPTLVAEVLRRYAAGISLIGISRMGDMPGRETMRQWEDRDDSFRTSLARARELHAEALVERAGGRLQELTDDDLVRLDKVASTAFKMRESRSAHDRYLAGVADDRYKDNPKVDVSVTTIRISAFADIRPKDALPAGTVQAVATVLPPTVAPDAVKDDDA